MEGPALHKNAGRENCIAWRRERQKDRIERGLLIKSDALGFIIAPGAALSPLFDGNMTGRRSFRRFDGFFRTRAHRAA